MRCIKCKKEIAEDLLRCNFCNTKVQTVCPVCKTKNYITAEFCEGCGLQLLKYCPACKSANLPSAANCRKCGNVFEEEISLGTVTIEEIEEPQAEVLAEAVEKSEDEFVDEPVEEVIEEIVEEPVEEIIEEVFEVIEVDEFEQIEEQEEIEEEPEPVINLEPIDEIDEETSSPDFDLLNLSDEPVLIADVLKKENIEAETIINPEAIEFEEEIPMPAEDIEESAQAEEFSVEEPAPQIEVPELPKTPEEEGVPAEIPCYDQMQCKKKMSYALRTEEKVVLGLSAPEGYGKTTVLKYLFSDFVHQKYAWLWGECSANSQISPYGIFQEMILTFFNMPNFSNMSAEFLKQAKNMLSENFPMFTQEEIFNLFNFLYPSLTANFEDILVNRDETFNMLEKVVLEISKKAKLIIVIDDFDMIDGASYAFLSYFIDQNHLGANIKLIIAYKDNRITQGYFYSEKLAQNQYEDLRLAPLTREEADNFVKLFLNGVNPLPDVVFNQIYENSEGNSAYIEQILVLLNENKAFYPENNVIQYRSTPIELNLPKNIYEIMTVRLEHLKEKQPAVFKTLCTAAIMGNKFNILLLELIMKLKPEDFKKVIQILTTFAYVSQFNNNIFEFKNTILWKFVYEKAKQSRDFVVLNEKIFDIINSFTLSSNALKALIAQNLNQKLLALSIWTDNIKLCAYLGDEHLWTLSQKQCLKIAQEVNPENNNVIINNINERLGKLLYETKPAEAVEYLTTAISNAMKLDNQPKIIELSGYLSKSCSLTGNYHGVIEAVDTVLKIIDTPENRLETALIKYKKLKAMFSIGNAEEIFNLASNEIIPIVEQALSGILPNKNISMDVIYETWLECNLTVAMALISQGNNKAFHILGLIDEIIVKNNVTNKNYLRRVQLAKALAYSVQGQIQKSEDILITLTQETAKEIVEPEIISHWNFINILNKLYKQEWSTIKEDLYSVVTFANNYNDVLVKNLLKVILGKVFQEEGNLSKASDIYNEQVTVFAKEKIAIGALLCWYYIAKITLVTEGSDKALEIAQKALDVANNPKINNIYFGVLYQRLMAEIFLIKGDMDAAKMYIEKSLLIVKQYDLRLLKATLYQLYAKYLEEMANKKPSNKATYAQNAVNTYKKALSLVKDLEIPALEQEMQKNFSSFKAYCQLNDIKL